MRNVLFILVLLAFSCEQKQEVKTVIAQWQPYDESAEIAANANNESIRLQYKLIQSRVSDKNRMLSVIGDQIAYFSEEDYASLTPLVLEQDILTIQTHIKAGKLTYEKLTQWYLYRIAKYENDSLQYLNNIISINPNAVAEARVKDQTKSANDHPIFGIPVLAKDNINFDGIPTTAGTYVLKDNIASDAFIIKRIKDKGGIVLGKTNLSEWANFLCIGCPNGYSAVGGQTLNPYGRKKFDTGGSSSGTGSAIAANFAAVGIGTETSGSILSPSSSSSLVGLKPTTGLLSRNGIVPLSSTLDTPGPMTKSVIDNAILLSVMTGEDPGDKATKGNSQTKTYWEDVKTGTLTGKRFGVIRNFLEDSIYSEFVGRIEGMGGILVEFEPEPMDFEGFGKLLRADMLRDLPVYLNQYAASSVKSKTVAQIVDFNNSDSTLRIPYGQGTFESILTDLASDEGLDSLRAKLNAAGRQFFEKPMREHNLDVVLSINNWNAGQAAAAKYPCLTVPMGYKDSGQPIGLTFIARPFEEDKLLKLGYAFESATNSRKIPVDYR